MVRNVRIYGSFKLSIHKAKLFFQYLPTKISFVRAKSRNAEATFALEMFDIFILFLNASGVEDEEDSQEKVLGKYAELIFALIFR